MGKDDKFEFFKIPFRCLPIEYTSSSNTFAWDRSLSSSGTLYVLDVLIKSNQLLPQI